MKFIECSGCWAEFRVVSDTDEPVSYCPYCGAEIEHEDEELDEDEYDK